MDTAIYAGKDKGHGFECSVLDMDQQKSPEISVKPEAGSLVNL